MALDIVLFILGLNAEGGGPIPPEGFAFVVDGDGNYVVDNDGAYVVAEI